MSEASTSRDRERRDGERRGTDGDRRGADGDRRGADDRRRDGEEQTSVLECEDCMSPADAFSVVANETRLSILEALWRSDERPIRFSELRRSVGVRDSAQFNYHLGKLTGQFVTRSDDGYDLKHAGEAVVRAVLAGTFTEQPQVEPFDVGDSCVACGSALRANYADETLSITCSNCGKSHGRYGFPPGGLTDRDEAELLRAFDQRVRHLHCLAADGVCPECNGRMNTEIVESDGGERVAGNALELDVFVEHACEQCRHRLHSSVGLSLLDTAQVVSAYRERGIDLTAAPYWTLPWCVSDEYVEVVDRDPYRLRVSVPVDGDTLVVALDGDLEIQGAEQQARH